MSSRFHSSPSWWLDMTLVDLEQWTAKAMKMIEEQERKSKTQDIGPGL